MFSSLSLGDIMDTHNMGYWIVPYILIDSGVRWRGMYDVMLHHTHLATPPLIQVTFSQTLGVIGYSLLPLLISAPVISLIKSFPWISFLLKVWILILLLWFLPCPAHCRVWLYSGHRTAQDCCWLKKNSDIRSHYCYIRYSYCTCTSLLYILALDHWLINSYYWHLIHDN